MRARFPWSPVVSDEQPQIEPLSPDRLRDLRLSWLSRFDRTTLGHHLDEHPGMSLWVPRTGEYAVAGPWRRRSEIAQVLDVHARKGKPLLVQTLKERLRERGYSLLVMLDDVWKGDSKVYAGLGIAHLESIVFFHKDLNGEPSIAPAPRLELDLARSGIGDLDTLMEVDHASFPWLWWNSRGEFEDYLQLPRVYAYLALSAGDPVGYYSFTLDGHRAHLDRIAVVHHCQGRGFGSSLLHHALHIMRNLRATSVALSTQSNNVASHALYQSFGFYRTRQSMTFYGTEL